MKAASTWGAMQALFLRDLTLAQRRKADVLGAGFFFVIVVSLFPLGVGPEPALLLRMGPGVVWVAALLASMLSMGRLFADDHADGTLEQMLLSPTPLALLVLAKTAAHWLSSGLLLVLMSPLLALQFDQGGEADAGGGAEVEPEDGAGGDGADDAGDEPAASSSTLRMPAATTAAGTACSAPVTMPAPNSANTKGSNLSMTSPGAWSDSRRAM